MLHKLHHRLSAAAQARQQDAFTILLFGVIIILFVLFYPKYFADATKPRYIKEKPGQWTQDQRDDYKVLTPAGRAELQQELSTRRYGRR